MMGVFDAIRRARGRLEDPHVCQEILPMFGKYRYDTVGTKFRPSYCVGGKLKFSFRPDRGSFFLRHFPPSEAVKRM
jgi:hypothetical protein